MHPVLAAYDAAVKAANEDPGRWHFPTPGLKTVCQLWNYDARTTLNWDKVTCPGCLEGKPQ